MSLLSLQDQILNNPQEGLLGSSHARLSEVKTDHGTITAPQFMPVGTQATVKGITPRDLKAIGAQVILGNTYHLYLRPGHALIERLGGLHEFMNWDQPILTDSGGYQVFSLSHLNRVTEEGVEFRSHLDGSKHFFTPEKSMEIQKALGSDIVMAFDECPAYAVDKKKIAESMERTLRWARRCRDYPLKPHQKLFGIVQGGVFLDLRQECLERLQTMGFDGYALGGLAIGEPIPQMHEIVRAFAPQMPKDKPRYLMGVGRPEDLLVGVSAGIDLFDCVMPTRNARNGQLFTHLGKINIKNARYKEDVTPLDPSCSCYTCTQFTKAYLRHLYSVQEMLAGILGTIHNLSFYLGMMSQLRQAILENRFDELARTFYKERISTQEG